ncbi:hypothetical protein HQQ80_11420 [Microbacteriaceae bacterium VKM Ac-2855]|nr:hypothetical protein [Microbacteriaceae bacterium VKM Ac-2855]
MPTLTPAELSAALTLRDLSDPAHGPHAMQLVVDEITAALAALWPRPVEIVRDGPLVAVADNYDALGFDAAAVTRDRRYSRYLSSTVMLRSHTSAAMPPRMRMLRADDDRVLLAPGLVYRRDAIDRTHVGEPHQLDVWRLSSDRPLGDAALADAELREAMAAVVDAVQPGAAWRAVPAVHPYTVGGYQLDVRMHGEWLELAECGLVAPGVLRAAGLSPERWSGLALGLGLDRALMLRKGVPDIRLLRATEPRIATQMLDLEPWRPVSSLPSIRRDLSIVVGPEADAETLGDQVRRALGESADDIESVRVLAATPAAALPAPARERLRIRADQQNVLLRITLRPIERTLTDAQANVIRDTIYRAVHEGPVLELIG